MAEFYTKMAGHHLAVVIIAGLTFSLVDSFSESRLEAIPVPGVGVIRSVIAFHNKDGVCRWSLFERTLHKSVGIASSKWYFVLTLALKINFCINISRGNFKK